MPVQIKQNNKFYNTFTPFITPKTRSAEKTIAGRKERKEFQPPYKFRKEFYGYLTAGGFLAFPILAMAISQKNIFTALRKTDTETFRLAMSDNNGMFHTLSVGIAKVKKGFLARFWDMIQPFKESREKLAGKLNKNSNENVVASLFISSNLL